MNLNFILQHPELQAVVAMLFVGGALVSLREPKLAGRWIFVFLLLLMSIFTPGTTGFIFLLVAETFSYLAFEQPDAIEPAARTVRFIINISVAAVCLLSAVVLNQTIQAGASVPIYIWIYFSFVGLPFSLARTRGPHASDSTLIYLFCFALCFRHFVGAINTTEWTTALMGISVISILIGNPRASGLIAILGICGLSPLHLAFGIPLLAVSVAPGILFASVFPLAMMAWCSAAIPPTDISTVIFPTLFFLSARASYVEPPARPHWKWAIPTGIAALLIGLIWYLNHELIESIYDKIEIGDVIVWSAFGVGLHSWNFLDRKIAWFSKGVREWHLPSKLSHRYDNMKKSEAVTQLKSPLWEDVITPAQAQRLLRGHVQLTAWFAAMLIVVSIFYWLGA